MGRVSLPPPVCDTNLSQRVSFENNNNNNNLREASFSSYLNHAEREFVRKLAESTRDHHHHHRHRCNNSKQQQQQEHGDIEVFGAEKYYNIDTPNYPMKLRPNKQQQQIKPRLNRPKSGSSTTPSVRSEGSRNSQNALLQNVNNNNNKKMKKTTKKKKKSSEFVKGFLYKLYCCDKKSVEVEYSIPKRKQPPPPPPTTTTKAGGDIINFTFQSLIPKGEQQAAGPRKSIEVFGSSLNNLGKKMAWNDMVPICNNKIIYDEDVDVDVDVESDTSSDLFEIENITTGNLNYNSMMTVTSEGCDYAPSEASIDWSVITADYHDESTTPPITNISAAAAYIINKSIYGSDYACKDIQRLGISNHHLALIRSVAGDYNYDSSTEIRRRTESSFGRLSRF